MLEAERIGFGASGRSGGQIIPGLVRRHGEDRRRSSAKADAKRLWDFSVEGVELTRELIERQPDRLRPRLGPPARRLKPRQREELLDMQREQEDDFGYRKLRFMERDESPNPGSRASATSPGSTTRARATCIRCATRSASARPRSRRARSVFEKSEVTDIQYGPTVTVKTAKGSVRAKFVALCANVGHVDLSDRLARKLIGVASYIVATKPLGAERAAALLKDNIAVADLNWIIDYYRLSADYRLLFGGRVSYSGLDPLGTERATRLRMLNVFPQLADVEIDYAWGGMIDITMSRLPNFGRLEPNVYYLQGYSGHGMVATTDRRARSSPRRSPGRPSASIFLRASSTTTSRAASSSAARSLVMAMTWFRLRDLMP